MNLKNQVGLNRPETKKKCNTCGMEYKKEIIKILNKERIYNVPACDCREKKEKLDFYKEQGMAIKDRIKSIKDCGIGKLYRDKTFSNFIARDKNLEKAKIRTEKYALDYVRNFKAGKDIGSLLITGNVGTGKTHLVAAIIDYLARLLKRREIKIVFTTAINLMRLIKFSFDYKDNRKFEETIKGFQCADLLIIDDIGSEYGSEFTKEILFSVIDYRYSEMLPTIITTNLNLSTLRERAGNDRLISRLLEYDMLIIDSKDYRAEEKISIESEVIND